MKNRTHLPMLVLMVLLINIKLKVCGESFRFLATGDLPYSAEQFDKYRQLLQQSKSEDFSFLVHVGDFKASYAECSDQSFDQICQIFRNYPKPVVYTPGDNDWTDCHRTGQDPIERLKKLRLMFYHDHRTLRLNELNVEQQSRNPRFKKYIENYRFTKSNVLFVVAHIVGSNNNYWPQSVVAMNEFRERNTATLAFLKESFTLAERQKFAGVILIIHANPNFENSGEYEYGNGEGFVGFLNLLHQFLASYSHPVICIHGDTHLYRIDKPFKDRKDQVYNHFRRIEVFGSPFVSGVDITVNTNIDDIFNFQPYYLKK
ncbi:metallophosphoesterase [Candidatus Poribacteria bacterium]|nr:metallophosphoesterase [Candidatus Poribacteria bacterium]